MNTPKWHRVLLALVCVTLFLVPTTGSAAARPTRPAEIDFTAIDAYLETQLKDLGIPGMALGIVQEGKIVHLQGFGVADSSGRKVTPQTPFYLASVTKSFTALAVMQLVEAGKIDLDTPVQKYLPWFELADKAASAKITVRNLLNQTTGMTRMDGDRDWARQRGSEEVARGLKTLRPAEPVGTTYHYSNLNYNIAGFIVEKVSGQSYEDYVTQHIFEPLDMRHSYASRAPALAGGLSDGHHYMFGHAFPDRAESAFGLASGGLIASAEDMSHYAIAHLNGGRYGDTPVLSAQGINELHAPAVLAEQGYKYSMGWDVGTSNGTRVLQHLGALSNFSSAAVLLPDEGRGFVLLANANGFEQLLQLDGVAAGVLALLNGKPPAQISAPWQLSFLYWTVLLLPLLMILGIVYSRRRWRNKGLGHTLLTVVVYGALAWFCLVGVPLVTNVPMGWGLRSYYPELFYSLIAGATLGIGWSVIYAVMNLRARRSR